MNEAVDSDQITLMDQLRSATHSSHEALQQLAYFKALFSEPSTPLPLESYIAHLRALAVIHNSLEQLLKVSKNTVIGRVWNDEMSKSSLLQQDLQFFEPRAIADILETVDLALNIVEDISLRSVVRPISLLGILYVLEGSSHGAIVLAPLIARAYSLKDNEGIAYLHGDGDCTSDRWSGFQQRMNALELEADDAQHIIDAAKSILIKIALLFSSLYPFKAESAVYRVTSINPEAGRHPIPSDSREVDAALRAADLCWQRFPYYAQRYGERGLRFAHSDGAWLVTLCEFDQARINQQINWLARVLATRGMPTILLQHKLELLYEQLSAAVPDKKASYDKLVMAASILAKQREEIVGMGELQQINQAFKQSVGIQLNQQHPDTGLLLACAVVDEQLGMSGALNSLQQWMVDESRFPALWVAAVNSTIEQTRVYINEQ